MYWECTEKHSKEVETKNKITFTLQELEILAKYWANLKKVTHIVFDCYYMLICGIVFI